MFFHKTDVQGTFWDLKRGDQVMFELLKDTISGPRAQKVRAPARETFVLTSPRILLREDRVELLARRAAQLLGKLVCKYRGRRRRGLITASANSSSGTPKVCSPGPPRSVSTAGGMISIT